MKPNPGKAAVIGCGFVGAATAYTLMLGKLFSEIVMIDVNHDKAIGEAEDISDGIPFTAQMRIFAGDYDDLADAGVAIITAGANQKPGESRLDLVNKNVAILKNVIPAISKAGFEGIILVVANPVDILTYVTSKLSTLPEKRVIGSGTVLDTARLKHDLGMHLGVDSRSVHAFVIGEHGDSEIVAWNCANVSGIPIREFCEMRGYHDNHDEELRKIANQVKNSAYDIISKKGATYYGIAMSVRRICECIVHDEKSILPISTVMHGEYGISGVALSTPAILGSSGVETHVPICLDESELEKLRSSASMLRDIADKLDI